LGESRLPPVVRPEFSNSHAALDLSSPLPPNVELLNKWKAEPVRYIFVPATTFISNTKGYPVLPKVTQKFVRDCMIVCILLLCEYATDQYHLARAYLYPLLCRCWSP
jgi:hypothetical protein